MTLKTNALIREKSPYLQQHAHNPFDWKPWSPATLKLAQESEKPIFLSIGYSACHWCHVMENESFTNAELADFFNEHFICIKVDREERPDLDAIYMKACQAITGQGGWPLNCFLTPEGKPFFAATYLPLEDRYQRPGMFRLGRAIQELWANRRDKLINDSNQLINVLESYRPVFSENTFKMPEPGSLEHSAVELESRFDAKFGGFDQAPKFPNPQNLLYLLYRYQFRADGMKYQVLNHTLNQMAMGGLFDHVGGGFTRYTIDAQWEIPHFEKMIWDNAFLLLLYAESAIQFDNPFYRYIAESTAMYLLRDLRSDEGGFYTAEDADSEGKEGRFYLWKISELQELFGDQFNEFSSLFKVSAEGNFNDPHHPEPGFNHLTLTAETRQRLLQGDTTTLHRLTHFQKQLFDRRQLRQRPFRDEKILTDASAYTAMALARAARLLNQPYWIEVAEETIKRIIAQMEQGDFFYHRLCEGEVAHKSPLDDYAALIWALIELYQSTLNSDYLNEAMRLAQKTLEHFGSEEGWFYYTLAQQKDLILRSVEIYDGAQPSGNSVMAYNLIRLYQLTGDAHFLSVFEKQIKALHSSVSEHWSSHCLLMIALDHYYLGANQLTFISPQLTEREDKERWLSEVSELAALKDMRLLLRRDHPDVKSSGFEHSPLQNEKYLFCKGQSCFPPTSDFQLLKDLILGVV